MSKNNTLVSVVMSVYNGERYLDDAIASILDQTYSNFEFIIINDGSNDNTLKIIKDYQKQDKRIKLISRQNKGLIASLNEGISIAKGKYIARMDSDDISLPNRLQEQAQFLDKNSHIDMCGSYIQLFDDKKTLQQWQYPLTDEDIKLMLMFISPFAHPSVMIKKSIFDNYQYTNFTHIEDYKLWADMALGGCKMSNIDKVLLKYRYHDKQISNQHRQSTLKNAFKISQYYLTNHSKTSASFAKNLASIASNANIDTLDEVFAYLKEYRKQHSISDKYYLFALRQVLKMCSPVRLAFVFVYYKYTKQLRLSKDIKGEIYIFIQALLGVNKNSKLYKILKNLTLS